MPASQVRGFTLIELMIVIGIIGILAAIAIPAYQDYIARAQVSEGVELLASAKTPLAEFYADQGRWPASAGSVITVTAGGRYVIAGFLLTGAGTTSLTMTLEATFRPDKIARSIASKKLDLETNDGAKTWLCHASATNGVAPQYLPGACK